MRGHSPAGTVPGHRSADSGFSLVEVLVALVVMAAAASFLPDGFRAARQALQSDARMESEARAVDARNYVSALISDAMPLTWSRPGDSKAGVTFWGRSDSLVLIAARLSGPDGAGLYLHTLSIAKTSQARVTGYASSLVLKVSPFNPSAIEEPEASRETVLLDAPAELRFRYFGASRAGEDRQWLDEWSRADALPDLVELSPAPGSGQGRTELPPVLVAPRLGRKR